MDQGGPRVVLCTYGSLDKKREWGKQAYLLFTSISRCFQVNSKQTSKQANKQTPSMWR